MKRLLLIIVAGLLLVGCDTSDSSAPDDARPTPTRAAAALLAPTPAVVPVTLPADDAPHANLTEWWYYTGHLFTPDGTRYGFEYVVFQALRAAFPPYYAAHAAITDSAGGRFVYDQRTAVNASHPVTDGFNFTLDDWTMVGGDGSDHLQAGVAGFQFDLQLTSARPPVLHNGTGYVEFGQAGGSYYYSRTRIDVSGTLVVDGAPQPVHGEAWFDHQWGDFIAVGAGGWDWFSMQLDDGTDLTLSLVRDQDGGLVTAYGTLIEPDGSARHLEDSEFVVTTWDSWKSPRIDAIWPAAWLIEVPEHGLTLEVLPVLADQELDVRESTGNIYWEGEVTVSGQRAGQPLAGLGYVELTGYATGLPVVLEVRPGDR